MMNPEERKLMKRIQMLGFALYDTQLYLNTHPDDPNALNYFRKTQRLYNMAVDEYSQKFGPLNIATANIKNKWTWIDKPWPWQVEA